MTTYLYAQNMQVNDELHNSLAELFGGIQSLRCEGKIPLIIKIITLLHQQGISLEQIKIHKDKIVNFCIEKGFSEECFCDQNINLLIEMLKQ